MRLLIFTISALFFFTFSFAQSSAESKSILDKASQLYEKSEGVKLSFVIETEDADGSAYEPQKGIAFAKENKFKLDLSYATTWFDGKTQWVLLKDANEVNISNPTQQELVSISPLVLLNMYKTDYTLKKPTHKTVEGKEVVQIDMTPINGTNEFTSVNIVIDKKTNNVMQVMFTTRNGIKNRLTITDYDSNNKFSNDLFTFNKHNHSEVEIIDLR